MKLINSIRRGLKKEYTQIWALGRNLSVLVRVKLVYIPNWTQNLTFLGGWVADAAAMWWVVCSGWMDSSEIRPK